MDGKPYAAALTNIQRFAAAQAQYFLSATLIISYYYDSCMNKLEIIRDIPNPRGLGLEQQLLTRHNLLFFGKKRPACFRRIPCSSKARINQGKITKKGLHPFLVGKGTAHQAKGN